MERLEPADAVNRVVVVRLRVSISHMHIVLSLLLWAIGLAIALLPTVLLVLWVKWQKRSDARRSPLTTELHHLPGEEAGNQAERLMDKANERLLFATLVGPAVLAAWAFQRLHLRLLHFGISEGILLLFIVIVAFWCAKSGVKSLKERRQYLDGLAAERATAQELAPLIAKGCAVYHDVPGNKFNLDHVVIGPCKVFIVETKSRQKPGGRGAGKAQVTFDGTSLHFPSWRETALLDQARRQARWLAEYLYRKTGERVRVEPVLALPGWFVSSAVPNTDVRVINPKMHNFMADADDQSLSDSQRRRIMTAIEERYRQGEAA